MPRPRGRPRKSPQLSLVVPPTRERAWELVDKFPVNGVIREHRRNLAGLTYYRVQYGAKLVYLGSEEKRQELEHAWRIVRAEVEAARPRELAELEARAGLASTRAPRTRGIPILGVAK